MLSLSCGSLLFKSSKEWTSVAPDCENSSSYKRIAFADTLLCCNHFTLRVNITWTIDYCFKQLSVDTTEVQKSARVKPSMRRPTWCGILGLVLATLLCDVTQGDDQSLTSLIDYLELDYEDQCNNKGEVDWKVLLGVAGVFNDKLELDKSLGNIKENNYDVKVESAEYDINSQENPLLNRKLELFLVPGDQLLDIDQWNRLVSFGDETEHVLETSRDYNCGGDPNEPCTLTDVRRRLASEAGDGVRKRIKASWEKKLPDENLYITQILPLLSNASKVNGFDSVEKYWEALVEYEGALVKAHELWAHVRPLYEKLQRHVANRLAAAGFPMEPDTSIPVRALGSLLGDNWINTAEYVLPKHADIYDLIKKNLVKKSMGGREAFSKASQLLKLLNLGEVGDNFWNNSVFDKTCPTKLVDFCVRGAVRAFTCNDISLDNYLDAHEALMKVRYNEMGAAYSNNTYTLRHPNRQSAVFEAVAGLTSVLAVSPQQLDRSKLVPLKYFEKNSDHNKLILQIILALRDLPRLNYYLAADEWRLSTLKQFPAPIPLGKSWSDFRRSFSLVAPGDKDFLGDPYILHNKPYLAKFFGIILKYQIYQSFDDYSDGDIASNIAANQHRLFEPMTRAYSVKWPELVSDIVAKKEYGVDSTGLNDYFSLLNNYLDQEQESENELYDNFDPPQTSDLFEATSEDPNDQIEDDTLNKIDKERLGALEAGKPEKEDIMIDSNTDQELPNKNMPKNDEVDNHIEESTAPLKNKETGLTKKAGAYNIYLWIGIGVVIAIILILILIIVKKRYNHRKQLEKERKDHSRA